MRTSLRISKDGSRWLSIGQKGWKSVNSENRGDANIRMRDGPRLAVGAVVESLSSGTTVACETSGDSFCLE